MSASSHTPLLVLQIDEILRTLKGRRLVTTDEVADRLLDLRGLVLMTEEVRDITDVDTTGHL